MNVGDQATVCLRQCMNGLGVVCGTGQRMRFEDHRSIHCTIQHAVRHLRIGLLGRAGLDRVSSLEKHGQRTGRDVSAASGCAYFEQRGATF